MQKHSLKSANVCVCVPQLEHSFELGSLISAVGLKLDTAASESVCEFGGGGWMFPVCARVGTFMILRSCGDVGCRALVGLRIAGVGRSSWSTDPSNWAYLLLQRGTAASEDIVDESLGPRNTGVKSAGVSVSEHRCRLVG